MAWYHLKRLVLSCVSLGRDLDLGTLFILKLLEWYHNDWQFVSNQWIINKKFLCCMLSLNMHVCFKLLLHMHVPCLDNIWLCLNHGVSVDHIYSCHIFSSWSNLPCLVIVIRTHHSIVVQPNHLISSIPKTESKKIERLVCLLAWACTYHVPSKCKMSQLHSLYLF